MTGGYEIGLSGSAASSSKFTGQFGSGDVHISTGGGKQSQTLYIVLGAVAVAIVLAMLFKRR